MAWYAAAPGGLSMSHAIPDLAPPDPAEYAPFYQTYIARVASDRSVGEQLLSQVLLLERADALVDPAREGFAYAPGKWQVRQVIDHLGHAERVFGYRALRCSVGDPTPMPGFDENLFVAEAPPRSAAAALEEFRHLRYANIAMLSALRPEQWLRTGIANGQAISVRALAYILVGHVEHHLAVLRERYGLVV